MGSLGLPICRRRGGRRPPRIRDCDGQTVRTAVRRTVRRYVETLPEGETGWLAGLRDIHVARALALLHRDIARPWTVDELGRQVGLSRSALADRFIRLIGVPPMHYLANWRMQIATQRLRNTSSSLAQVADMVGYESEAAFSRAFKRAVGTAPATWRRSHS